MMNLYHGKRLIVQQDIAISEIDRAVDVKFGKLSLENTSFVSKEVKHKTREEQQEDRRMRQLVQEYFPPIEDTSSEEDEESEGSEADTEEGDEDEADVEEAAEDLKDDPKETGSNEAEETT